jgi:hypothetical protein
MLAGLIGVRGNRAHWREVEIPLDGEPQGPAQLREFGEADVAEFRFAET